jgi:ABC-type dipeptide/oligopeptide/nickel transport system permease subunit
MSAHGIASHVEARRRSRRSGRATAIVGGTMCAAVLMIAFLGPLLVRQSPTAIVGFPFEPGTGLLGTDFLGRDVFSRILVGGRGVILLALVSTFVGYLLGAVVGLAAGYSRSGLDTALMRVMDVLLGFPPLLFVLVIAAGLGRSWIGLVLAVAVIQLPSIARVVRGATLEQVGRPFVEAAVARGEHTSSILRREVLPNIARPLLADAGLRLTWSILLIAAVSFLGLGDQPPASNWALMIAENRTGLSLQPWPVVVPAILIALLTIGINLLADGVTASLGESSEDDA